MSLQRMEMDGRQVVMHTAGAACETAAEVTDSHAFAQVVHAYCDRLRKQGSTLLEGIPFDLGNQDGVSTLVRLLRAVAEKPLDEVARCQSQFANVTECRYELYRLVEGLYDFWRQHDRFLDLPFAARAHSGRAPALSRVQRVGRTTDAPGARALSRRLREHHGRSSAGLSPSGRRLQRRA